MERETSKSREAGIEIYEAHEDDEMTEAELNAMQLGSDFFTADELAELCAFAPKPAPAPRPHRNADVTVRVTKDGAVTVVRLGSKATKLGKWQNITLQGWQSRRLKRAIVRAPGPRRDVA